MCRKHRRCAYVVARKENSILHKLPNTFGIMSGDCSVSQISAYLCACEKLCDMHCRVILHYKWANGIEIFNQINHDDEFILTAN